MARYEWQAVLNATNVPLDDVQSISITKGRQQVQDPFKAGVATITGRNPQNLPTLNIGEELYIQCLGPSFGSFVYFGVVSDLRIKYGEVANIDTWTLELEDALALAGRATTTSNYSWAAGIRTDEAAFLAGQNAGIGVSDVYTTLTYISEGQSFVSAQSLPNANLMQVLNQLAATEQGRLVQSGYDVGFINRSDLGKGGFEVSFSDGSLAATYPVTHFNSLDFRSLSDSYFNHVVVEPVGLASQQSGTGDASFVMSTYDQTTAQAQSLAAYVLQTLDVNEPVPSAVAAISEIQTNNSMIDAARSAGMGKKAELILRGSRYNVFVEGCSISATPEQTRISYNLISSDAQNFFILNNANFGVLNTNKLGF